MPRLVGTLVGLVVAAAVVLYLVPSNDYLLLARPRPSGRTARRREGRQGPDRAGRDLLRRRVRAAREHVRVALPVDPQGRDARSGEADRAAGRQRQRRTAGRPAARCPSRSSVAAAVALQTARLQGRRAADRRHRRGVDDSSHAVGKLRPTDVIIAGERRADARRSPAAGAARKVKPGDTVTLGDQPRRRSTTARRRRQDDRRPAEHEARDHRLRARSGRDIQLPLKVSIDAGNVGGPSAGLAFALEVMEELGRNVDSRLQGRRDRPDRARRDGRRRSAASSRRRSASARPARTSSSCRLGITRRRRGATRTGSDHRCEEFSTGVAGAGNAAPEALETGSFEPRRNCRKFVSFRRRQRLIRGNGPRIALDRQPAPPTVRTNEQTSQSDLQ